MKQFWRYLCCSIVLIAMVPPKWADAQPTSKERHEIAAMLASKMMDAMRKHHGGLLLQEEAIRRMAECALLYGVLSKQAPDQRSKEGAALAAEISKDVLFKISVGVSMDVFKKETKEARDVVVAMSKPQNRKSLSWLLRDCESFRNLNEIDDAVAELPFKAP